MRGRSFNGKTIAVLVTFLVFFMAIGVAEEERVDAGGQWTYVLEDGGATITGYTADELTGRITIPCELDGYPVTGIGGDAFYWCESLTGVVIPDSVTTIGDNAFYWCESLTRVVIPDSVTSIGEWAFKECFSLASVTIGRNVTSIGGFAFFGCESLTHVAIPDSVTSIGEYAFAHCYSLLSMTVPASVTHIGESAFYDSFYDSEARALSVQEGSYAERYAEENGLLYTFDEIRAQPNALSDLYVLEDWDTGMALDAALTPAGMLLTGASDYWAGGWATFIDNEGQEAWSLEEGDELYLCPTPLANGGFAVLCKRGFGEEMDDESQSVSLMILNQEGAVVANPPVPRYARDIVAAGDSIFVLGNQEAEEADCEDEPAVGEPFLTRFGSGGEPLWTQNYTQPKCGELRFQKAVYAEESLIIGANADVSENGPGICLLYRFDLDGNCVWAVEAAPEIGEESSIVDVCVNENGIIAMVCGEYAYDEEYGDPLDRLCDVFGLDMDGAVLWNHKMSGVMADYILPVRGGFLCASQGLDLYNCPYLGDGWVQLLDENGNVKAADSAPDIGGGAYEVYGMAKGASGEAFLYGTLLDDPGFPGAPFIGRLDFPQAYQAGPID